MNIAWSVLCARRFRFVQMKSLGHIWSHPRGFNIYIVIYWEMPKKNCSQELLHEIGTYNL